MPAKPPVDAGSAKESAKVSKAIGKAMSDLWQGRGIEASRPFCSERCRDVDLNRWLSNSYAIPASTDDDEDAE